MLEQYRTPKGEGVRTDDGFEEGMEIPIYYDPMQAKLIICGKTREEAIQLMIRLLTNMKFKECKTYFHLKKSFLNMKILEVGILIPIW
ncbi:hypothetical protein [Gillisia limnaea]|uniref:hypothetical protein n=1 Tax=Gillisia limnaea TaxID=195907 RepID=UPI00058F1FE9|nr:hypothetical protein [Gillisia limnaea]